MNDRIEGRLLVDRMTLRWRSGQSLQGVVVEDTAGARIIRIGRLDLPDIGLWDLLRGRLAIGRIEIESVTGDLVGYDDGSTNVQRALRPRGAGSSSRTTSPVPSDAGPTKNWPGGFSFDLWVRDVDLTYRAESVGEPIRLVVAEAVVNATDPNRLKIRLDSAISKRDERSTLFADVEIHNLFSPDGRLTPDQVNIKATTDLAELPVEWIDEALGTEGRYAALIGNRMNGHVLAEITSDGGTAALEWVGEHLNVQANLIYDGNSLRTDDDASSISLTVSPEAWSLITMKGETVHSELKEPARVALKLHRFVLPIDEDGLGLDRLAVDLSFELSDVRLAIAEVGDVMFATTAGRLRSDHFGEQVKLAFDSTSSLNGRPGNVHLEMDVNGLIGPDQRVNTNGITTRINGRLANAPIPAILDELLPTVTRGLATQTLGSVVDADMTVRAEPNDQSGIGGRFELDLLAGGGESAFQSALIGGFTVETDLIRARLDNGSYAALQVTPGLIDTIRRSEESGNTDNETRIALHSSAPVRLEIDRAEVSLNRKDADWTLDTDEARLSARLLSRRATIALDGRPASTIENLAVNLNANKGLGDQVGIEVRADLLDPADPTRAKPGSVESDTTVEGLFDDRGGMTVERAVYTTRTRVRQAPVDLIDALFGMNGDLVAAVGDRALLTVTGRYHPSQDKGAGGGIDLLVKSRLASVDLKLVLAGDRWALQSDAPLNFRVTPRFSQAVLKKVMPFLGGAVSAKLPIEVTVRQDGFSAPFRNPSLTDVQARIDLNLGELDLRGEGVLKTILEQLGVGDRSLLTADFSPVAIHLDDGQIRYEGLSMAIDDVKLVFSGLVDLNSRRLDLRMRIPGTSLSRIKWLAGKVDPEHVIEVPLTGTFDKPTVDIKLLTGEIAKAAIRGQVDGQVRDVIGEKIGGEAGAVVGGLLNEILTGGQPDENETQGATESADSPLKQETKAEGEDKRPVLTEEERQARKERRRLRRERLEQRAREQQEKEKDGTAPAP
ncbi:MAG: hypothetical protein Kow00105_10110 [Phycisphaeraceae bacterium]